MWPPKQTHKLRAAVLQGGGPGVKGTLSTVCVSFPPPFFLKQNNFLGSKRDINILMKFYFLIC